MKPEHRQKATMLQWVSPSHLIKFHTGFQSPIPGGGLKQLKQWSRICSSVHFFPHWRKEQNGLSMGNQEGCRLLAWANWQGNKWGSGKTLFLSVCKSSAENSKVASQSNSLKWDRQGKRKYYCLAAAFQSVTDGLCHSAGPWSLSPHRRVKETSTHNQANA